MSRCMLYPTLCLTEISFYTITWICAVCFAGKNIFIASQENGSRFYRVELVRPWWMFWEYRLLGQDLTHPEWKAWKIAICQVGAFVVLYPLLSRVLKRGSRDYSLLFSASYSTVVTMYLIGSLATLFLFMQIFTIWLAYQTNSAKIVWGVAISYMLCLQIYPLKTIQDSLFIDRESKIYSGGLVSGLLVTMNARCVSFALDRIWNRTERESLAKSFLMLTAFCFYLPMLIFGPLISSETFKDSFEKPHLLVTDRALWVNILKQSLRYGIWFTIYDVSLYFMYPEAISRNSEIVNSLNIWALCGLFYLMALLYTTKYVIIYGCSSFIAELDDVAAPSNPKCIARIHVYSDIWRYFDHGLYLFLKQYIYFPIISALPNTWISRLCAGAVSFAFVFLWHGATSNFLIWCTINFACITLEGLGRAVSRNATYIQWEKCYLNDQSIRRLHALLASPLLLMGHLSTCYFFFGMKVGNIFMRRILLESWPWGVPMLLFFLYCCSQTSIEVKNYEVRGNKNKKE